MNLVADEGVDRQIVAALRALGHSVVYLAELAPSSPDTLVLSLASNTQTLLLTLDKDFGELVFRQHLSTAGVLLIRLYGLSPEGKARSVTAAIAAHGTAMLGRFSVITPGQIRIRAVVE